MSTIQKQFALVHLDSGLNVSSALQFTANATAFSNNAISVVAVDEPVDLGDITTAREVFVKLISGDDLQIGFDGANYPLRLSGAGDFLPLRLDVEGLVEQTQFTCSADTNSSLSGKYFEIYDYTGLVRVWFNMEATAASGTITYGTPSEAVAASGVLTLASNPGDTETVTIGSSTYTFKTTLSFGPAVANEVLIGATASDSIDNLAAAITAGAGAGTLYGTGTVANTTATATAGALDTLDVEALTPGYTLGIATTDTLVDGGSSFAAATLLGGLDATTIDVNGDIFTYVAAAPGAGEFSTLEELTALIEANVDVSAVDDITTITITASVAGTAGNSLTLFIYANSAGDTSVSGSGTLEGGSAISTPPSAGGGRLVAVTLLENSLNTEVAEAVQLTLDADSKFNVAVEGAVLTITDADTGVRAPATVGDTPFAAPVQFQAGAASPVVHLLSTGTSQVVVAVAPN